MLVQAVIDHDYLFRDFILLSCLIILLIGLLIGETITASNIDQVLSSDKVPSVSIILLAFLALCLYFWPGRISGQLYST